MPKGSPRAFVCGHPIAHSRSPLIHGYWLATYGLPGSYEPLDMEPADFESFMREITRARWTGGNVTIPHKEAAFRAVRRLDVDAEEIGAVNTLWLEDGDLCGGNTDSYGFAANLDEHAPGWDQGRRAVVLGAGGAARAIIHALKRRGFADIRVVNRTLARAQEIADQFGSPLTAHGEEGVEALLTDADLLVNTTPLGMHGEALALDLRPLPDSAIVTDLVYVPLETPLLAAARGRGLKTVDGLGMLLHQAAPGFELWFGRRPVVSPQLRALVAADLMRQP